MERGASARSPLLSASSLQALSLRRSHVRWDARRRASHARGAAAEDRSPATGRPASYIGFLRRTLKRYGLVPGRVIANHAWKPRPSKNDRSCERSFLLQHQSFNLYPTRSRQIEAIKVHHLVPGRDEIVDKLLLRILTAINFGQSPKLGVRTEDQIDTRAGPLELPR